MSNFMNQYNGPLIGLLKWPQLDTLTATLTDRSDNGWYVYYVGEDVPAEPLSSELFNLFTTELTKLLRSDHQELYLGIVYVDDIEEPSFVKIYDPNNLGFAHDFFPVFWIEVKDSVTYFPITDNEPRTFKKTFECQAFITPI